MQDSFIESLESRGLTRRAFLGFCGTIAAAIGIEGVTAADVAEAIESNSLIGTDNRFGRYYGECRARGMRHSKALKAVARKRLKVIYAIMRDAVPYAA